MPSYLIEACLVLDATLTGKKYVVTFDCLLCSPVTEKEPVHLRDLFSKLTLAGYITQIVRFNEQAQKSVIYSEGFIGPPEPCIPWVAGVTEIDELPEKVQQALVNMLYEHLLENPYALREEFAN